MVSEADKVVGAWFRRIRKLHAMTQTRAAALLGVRRETVTLIEAGRRRLTVAELGLLQVVRFCDAVEAGDLVLTLVFEAQGGKWDGAEG